jgi:integrase
VASVWVRTRRTKDGGMRYRVEYRLGGRRTRIRYGGSFRSMREASLRKNWVVGELANKRAPDLRLLEAEPERAPTVAEMCERWRATRVDVDDATRTLHRVALARVLPHLGARRVDELEPFDIADLVAKLHAAGRKRETIRKSRGYLASVLDYAGVDPNPARDRNVKLPKERKPHVPPPLAEHVERVAEALAPQYVVPLLVVDECGPRVSELETAQIGDLDEHRRAIRVRWTVEKNERYRHLELPDDLLAAIVATLPPREDRELEAPLFDGLTDARLPTAITRACKATGVPHFSPHGLRRRRGSLHYKRTGSLSPR